MQRSSIGCSLSLLAAALVVASPLGAQAPHQSVGDLEAAVRSDSNDVQALYSLALGYWAKKRFDDAGRLLQLAVRIEPRFASGYLALGLLPYARRPKLHEEVAKGAVPEAWRDSVLVSQRLLRRAYLIDPFVDLRVLGLVDPAAVKPFAFSRGRILVNPFAAFQDGAYGLAYRYFDGAVHPPEGMVTHDSVPSIVLWYHALCAAHLDRNADAITDLQTLLARAEERELADSLQRTPLETNDYRYVLALMHERAAQWIDAVRLYRAALERDVGLYMAHVRLYKVYEARGMYDSAATESRAAVETFPDDPSLLLDHGIVLTEEGALAAAVDTLRLAMTANPRDSRVPYYLGVAEQALHDDAAARDAFTRFLSLAPSRSSRFLPLTDDARARLVTLAEVR